MTIFAEPEYMLPRYLTRYTMTLVMEPFVCHVCHLYDRKVVQYVTSVPCMYISDEIQ
jgi:hypothetical protein